MTDSARERLYAAAIGAYDDGTVVGDEERYVRQAVDAVLSDACRDDLAEAAGLYTRPTTLAATENGLRQGFQDGYRAGQRETAEKIADEIARHVGRIHTKEVNDTLWSTVDIARSYAKDQT